MIITTIDLTRCMEDALFAAMAVIGFAAVIRVPWRAFAVCAAAAATGHALRFALMSPDGAGMCIVAATALASLAVGFVCVALAPVVKTPAEACLFAALLPMIPGMYAYRAVIALLHCIGFDSGDHTFLMTLESLCYNALTCAAVVVGMALGGLLPVFLLKNVAYRATR